jgi:hypothetical protein
MGKIVQEKPLGKRGTLGANNTVGVKRSRLDAVKACEGFYLFGLY